MKSKSAIRCMLTVGLMVGTLSSAIAQNTNVVDPALQGIVVAAGEAQAALKDLYKAQLKAMLLAKGFKLSGVSGTDEGGFYSADHYVRTVGNVEMSLYIGDQGRHYSSFDIKGPKMPGSVIAHMPFEEFKIASDNFELIREAIERVEWLAKQTAH